MSRTWRIGMPGASLERPAVQAGRAYGHTAGAHASVGLSFSDALITAVVDLSRTDTSAEATAAKTLADSKALTLVWTRKLRIAPAPLFRLRSCRLV